MWYNHAMTSCPGITTGEKPRDSKRYCPIFIANVKGLLKSEIILEITKSLLI